MKITKTKYLGLSILLGLISCSNSHLVGTVIDKQFVPTHQEEQDIIVSYIPQIQLTEDCTYISGIEDCSPITQTIMTPVWGSELVWKQDAWYLEVRGTGGHKHWTHVDQSVFNSYSVGAAYDSHAVK